MPTLYQSGASGVNAPDGASASPQQPDQGAPAFPGFKPLSANFTQTPNQFYDAILGHYPLRVVTVVGILIRSTLGYEDPLTGERRIEAELPLHAFIRPELSESSARIGLREAIAAGFVIPTGAPSNKEGTRYALRWIDTETQKAAIERQRRAIGDNRPVETPVDIVESVDSEGVESTPSEFTPSVSTPQNGVSMGVESTPSDFRGPNSTPPTVLKKERSSERNVSYKQTLETLNVPGAGNIDNENPDLSLLPESVATAVREAIALTGDKRSIKRFAQLRDICEENGIPSAWSEALASTRKALKARRLRGSPGAYFNGTLSRLLQKHGVYVPVGRSSDRTEIRDAIAASLAAAETGPAKEATHAN